MGFLIGVSPHRPALLYKSSDALLSIMQCQIFHHDSSGSGVCSVSALSHLPLERRFPQSHHWPAALAHSACDSQRLLLQILLTHDFTHQSVQQSFLRGDRVACEQHLHSNLGKQSAGFNRAESRSTSHS